MTSTEVVVHSEVTVRPLTLLVCAGSLTMATGAAGRSAPLGVVVVAAGGGTPVATSFPTAADASYTITVSGTFTYNGITGFGLADCGHQDPPEPGPWIEWPWLLLDGKPADCASVPVEDTHTYTWLEPGTGQPFRFSVPDSADPSQNIGYLVVTVRPT